MGRYRREAMARTAGGILMLCLFVASVGRGEDGGDWRDRITLNGSC